MTPKYSFGVTDVESWSSWWKAAESDPDPDPEEWVTFLERIQEYFHSRYENYPDELYFWNDFSVDRTVDLKIVKPSALTAGLVADLQKYLQTHGQDMWRIRIPISFQPGKCHRMIVVYAHSIDIPPISDEIAA